jgi:hypothetical protein
MQVGNGTAVGQWVYHRHIVIVIIILYGTWSMPLCVWSDIGFGEVGAGWMHVCMWVWACAWTHFCIVIAVVPYDIWGLRGVLGVLQG